MRSRLFLRPFIVWTQTRLQPHSWPLILSLWCPTLKQICRKISPPSRELTILLAQHTLTGPSSSWCWGIYVFLFLFVLPACSATWMRILCSPGPPMPLSWLCLTTTAGWLDRQRTSRLSSWLSRTRLLRRLSPTLIWAKSCLTSCAPKVIILKSLTLWAPHYNIKIILIIFHLGDYHALSSDTTVFTFLWQIQTRIQYNIVIESVG